VGGFLGMSSAVRILLPEDIHYQTALTC